MPLKLVCFDAAGTLFETRRPISETYAAFARRYGLQVSTADLASRFRTCFALSAPLAFPQASPDAITELEYRWWRELVYKIVEPFGPFENFDDYFDALFAHFRTPQTWELYPETATSLRTLKEAGLSLAVVTNFDSRVLGILEGLGIASYFDSVWISSRVGYAKPAPEIFHQALKHHGVGPEEAMHIGDSPGHDVAGAAAAGLTAVLVDRRGKCTPQAHHCIERLDEVLGLIQRRP